MPDLHTYLSFVLAAFVLALIPGPGILYVLARSLNGGVRDGIQSSFGALIGGLFHVFASALGLSALIMASATAFTLVKYAGAAYLIYLGVRTLLTREQGADAQPLPQKKGALMQGIITEMLNPKTALFFLAFIPQFVHPEAGRVVLQFLVLGITSVLLNTLVDLAVAVFAGPLGSKLSLNAKFRQRQKLASGGAMIALGAYAALDH